MEKQWEYNGRVHQLFTDYEKAYKVRREVLYNILNEFGVPIKLVRLIKMCLNKTYSSVCKGTNNNMIQRDSLLLWLFNFALEYEIRNRTE